MIGWFSHYYSVVFFFVFFFCFVLLCTVVYRLTYEINSMRMLKCKCYCFYWQKYTMCVCACVCVCSHTCIYSHCLYNMINMKLKSKCSQMFELFVCAFAVNVYIHIDLYACMCAYANAFWDFVHLHLPNKKCVPLHFFLAKKLHLRIMLVCKCVRTVHTHTHTYMCVYRGILRTAYFILNLENPLNVCCYSSHLLRLANDLSILCDVSIINFVRIRECACAHPHTLT